ncbi:MAG: hypothetical protein NVS4B13_11810 [Candidatus Elarobacter sp.]
MNDQTTAPGPATDAPKELRQGPPIGRTLVWLGIAGASAALTFFVLRATMQRPPPSDETTDRIQDLIDEANRLIKTLDEKKQS